MKKIHRIVVAPLVAMLALSGCQNEEPFNKPKEGLPVNSVSFTMTSPDKEQIAITRASEQVESNVERMAILFYKGDEKPIIAYVDNMPAPSSMSGSNYKYTIELTEDQLTNGERKVTSGQWHIYAIANYDKGFFSANMNEIGNLNRTEFLDYCVMKGNNSQDITESAVLMSGKYCEDGQTHDTSDGAVTLTAGENTLTGVIHLRRIVAKITFDFSGSTNFTPESYGIFNYSRSSTLLERKGWNSGNGQNLAAGYKGIDASDDYRFRSADGFAIPDNKIFEFYMPENVQLPTSSPAAWTYNDREKRNSTDHSTFTYAPTYATYVVVKGQYKDATYQGNVEYTIHLGDFSKAAASNGNFTTRRNFHYTYRVKVTGVNKIIAEARCEDESGNTYQHGAEGHIVKTNDQFNIRLDAHYENAIIKIAKGATESYMVKVSTPYCDDETDGALVPADFDYTWIRFGKPATTTTFSAFNPANTVDVITLMNEIKSGDYSHCLESGNDLYIAAYVNEYFYDDKDINTFVNADDRTMTVNFGGVAVSTDGHSTYADLKNGFKISQRSIKTFYDLNSSSPNPYGFETIEETPEYPASTSFASLVPTGTNSNDGYSNIPSNLSGSSWATYVNASVNGYTSAGQTAPFAAGVTPDRKAIYQCMTRNRDNNGNGRIDADEIRWYLPAVNQCVKFWVGMNSVATEARINVAPNGGDNINYWTSTKGQSLWWADEGATFGEQQTDNNYNSTYGAPLKVRCVRSLKNYSGTTSPISSYDAATRVISIHNIDSKSTRDAGSQNGEYSAHYRNATADKVPTAFQVANGILKKSDFIRLTCTMSGYTKDESNLGKIVDGDTESGWKPGNNYQYNGRFVQVTFSTPVNIRKIRIESNERYLLSDAYPQNNNLEVLQDGNSEWKLIGGVHGKEVTLNFTAEQQLFKIKSIRIISTKDQNKYMGISEITITDTDGVILNNKDEFTVGEVGNSNLCGKYYSEESDKSDLGQWRIPNEKELSFMNNWMNHLEAYTAGRSKYYRKKDNLDMIYYKDPADGTSRLTTYYAADRLGPVMKLRCVRDTQGTTSKTYDSSFSNGGSGLGQ